jgi:hypothetical protein
MVPDTSACLFRLKLNEESLRENPRFNEISDHGIKIEKLSRTRQVWRFGIVNLSSNNLPHFSHYVSDIFIYSPPKNWNFCHFDKFNHTGLFF